VKKTLRYGSGIDHGYVARAEILKLKQKSATPRRRPNPYFRDNHQEMTIMCRCDFLVGLFSAE
jgi:hypothetical protein